MKILSIIVPAYNMENYLAKGLESILCISNPSVLDVIVINDGSKDRTIEIAKSFEYQYPGIVTVIDKENGNYGSCINVGLKEAKGKYIKILDADDRFATANFEKMVGELSDKDVDIFFTDLVKEYTSGKKIEYHFDLPVREIVDIRRVCNSNAFLDIQMPAITYRTELLKRINYHQTENISYTDQEWCFSPIFQAKTIYYLNIPVYLYLLGREGQTMDFVVMQKRISHTIKSFLSMLHSVEHSSIPAYLENFVNTRLFLRACYIYDFYLLNNKRVHSALQSLDAELMRCCPAVYNLCGKRHYRQYIPYCYIAKWRCGRSRIPVTIKTLAKIFDLIGILRLSLLKVKTKLL